MVETGLIRAQDALLDHEALGLQVEAHVTVTLASYARADVETFHRRITSIASSARLRSL